ncbi:MAG: two-component regulator propeller domain-containing protein [Bacteroidota bacterium]
MRISRSVLLPFFCIYYFFSTAQSHVPFKKITTDEGLIDGTVSCTLRDDYGFLWFGTQNGLCRYDGYEFDGFRNENDIKLFPSNQITSLASKDTLIFIGTMLGLSQYDWRSEQFSMFQLDDPDPNSISNTRINNLQLDSKKRLWISTDKGLFLYQEERQDFKRYAPSSTQSSIIISGVVEIATDQFLVATNNTIEQFSMKTGAFETPTYYLSDQSGIGINTMYEDSNDNIWVGSTDNGAFVFNRKTKKISQLNESNGFLGNTIRAIHEDKVGKIWIGTDGGGINTWNPFSGTFEYYLHDDFDHQSLSSNAIYSIYEDPDEVVWVGTYKQGLNFHHPLLSRFETFQSNPLGNGLSHNSVFTLFNYDDQGIWIGTDGGGANYFDLKTNRFELFEHKPDLPNSISSNVVTSIFTRDNKTIWLGTYLGGLNKLNKETGEVFTFKREDNDVNSLSSNSVWNIYEDSKGDVWLATQGGGMCLFDPVKGTFQRMVFDPNDDNSLSSDYVGSILEDGFQNLWASTLNGGINLMQENGKFTRFMHDKRDVNTLPSDEVTAIKIDSKGQLWAGTKKGLCYYDYAKKRFVRWAYNDLLPNKSVKSFEFDEKGDLWISGTEGIYHYRFGTDQVDQYTKSHGIQGNDFYLASSIKMSNGDLYFGGTEGFSRFSPEKVKPSNIDPKLVITKFELFGKEVHLKDTVQGKVLYHNSLLFQDEITLTHKQNIFNITFSSLDPTFPELITYRYKLDGFDDEWMEASSKERKATYMNLPAGDYEFLVKGTNASGKWSSHHASLIIHILPPWWATWWFRISLIVVIVTLFIFIYRWRIKQLKKQQVILESKIEERTADLKNMVSILKKNSVQLAKSGEDLKEKSGTLSLDAKYQSESAKIIEADVESVTSYTKKNSENSKLTNQISENTVLQLNHIKEATLHNMKVITSISHKMKDMGELFRQTNILSLNASVEAQRAGTYGAGFRVIAEEVRKLADRSNDFSKEIVVLTKEGEEKTQEVNQLIMDFIPEVQKSADLVRDITVASDEQNKFTEKINLSLKTFFNKSRENSQVLEELYMLSMQLDESAKYLSDNVKTLNL